jgi:hypothetical protein
MVRKIVRLTLLLAIVVAVALGAVLYEPRPAAIAFPDGKRFAFSIVDDTDLATLERLEPIYTTLEKYGFRTTKTVWVYDSNQLSYATNRGDSLSNPKYRDFIKGLKAKGFEIALHGVRGGSSKRDETLAGLAEFKNIIGNFPRMHVNHSQNRENLYWGSHLYDFAPLRWAAKYATSTDFSGEDPQSPYFWGDVAKERIEYVRRFTYPDINLLNAAPEMPYRLPDMPYVNYWFPTSNGANRDAFDELLKPENLDRLEREGGVCLVYAHLGAGSFNKGGAVHPRFEARVRELSARNGWFVPASEILDYLRRQPSWKGTLTYRERVRSDLSFILYRISAGVS